MTTLLGFVLACVLGSFLEYQVHKLLHGRLAHTALGKSHRAHHLSNEGRGFWNDFKDYLPLALVIGPLGIFFGIPFGAGWLLGSFFWVALVASAHHLAHLGLWPYEGHLAHHFKDQGVRFGIVCPFWDWAGGTRGEDREERKVPLALERDERRGVPLP